MAGNAIVGEGDGVTRELEGNIFGQRLAACRLTPVVPMLVFERPPDRPVAEVDAATLQLRLELPSKYCGGRSIDCDTLTALVRSSRIKLRRMFARSSVDLCQDRAGYLACMREVQAEYRFRLEKLHAWRARGECPCGVRESQD